MVTFFVILLQKMLAKSIKIDIYRQHKKTSLIYDSRNTLRKILPTFDFGNSVLNSTRLGTL